MQECLQPPPFSLKIYTLMTLKNRFQLLHCIKMRLRLPADLIEVKKKVCVYLSVCGGCGKDTLPVSLRCDTPSEHGAAFLRSTHCNPWRWRACPAARHYANVITLDWPQDCVCVHRMASHFTQTLLVPVVFLSALIELTSQKQTFAGERWDVA